MQNSNEKSSPNTPSQMNCWPVDLNRVERAVSSLTNVVQDDYHRRQLNSRRHPRYSYLPLYLAIACSPNDRLLLSNVPDSYFLTWTFVMNPVHVAFQTISPRKVNHGSLLIFIQVICIDFSMDIQHISIGQPYLFERFLIMLDQ